MVDVEIFSRLLGAVNSILWIGWALAEIIITVYPRHDGPRIFLYPRYVIVALVLLVIWRSGLLVTSYAVPFIDRGSVAVFIRLIDLLLISLLITRLGLVVRARLRNGKHDTNS